MLTESPVTSKRDVHSPVAASWSGIIKKKKSFMMTRTTRMRLTNAANCMQIIHNSSISICYTFVKPTKKEKKEKKGPANYKFKSFWWEEISAIPYRQTFC